MFGRGTTALAAATVVVGLMPGGPVQGAEGAAPASAAAAAFPGSNGRIAYTKIWEVSGTPGPDVRSDVFSVRPDGTGTKRLTFSRSARNPSWAPNGKRIAYQQDGAVWLMRADGAAKKELIDGELIGWMPTGGRILVARGLGYSNGVEPTWHLYTIATGVTEVLPIDLPIVADLPDPPYPDYSEWSYADEAALSPDGELLAVTLRRNDFASDQYDYAFGSFFTVRLDGSELTRIDRYTYSFGAPAWSSAGDQLVYWDSEPRSHRCQDDHLRSIKLDATSGAVTITKPCNEIDPAWSPNGKRIVFPSGTTLQTSNLAGTRIRTVVSGRPEVYFYEPDWQRLP